MQLAAQLAALEERTGNVEDDVREIKIDMRDMRDKELRPMRDDIAEIKEILAEGRGIANTIKYISHAFVGLIGVATGYLGMHK